MSNPLIPLDIPPPRVRPLNDERLFDRHMQRLITDIIRRLGGEREDWVREARQAALASQAMMDALLAGAIPEYAVLDPPASQLLDYTTESATTATVTVAEHTRSTAAATIEAGEITGVARDAVVYVYYDDPTNAGGAVTFATTTDLADLNVAGRKLVGALNVEGPPPTGGTPG